MEITVATFDGSGSSLNGMLHFMPNYVPGMNSAFENKKGVWAFLEFLYYKGGGGNQKILCPHGQRIRLAFMTIEDSRSVSTIAFVDFYNLRKKYPEKNLIIIIHSPNFQTTTY